jgi:hypothetical protein
LIACKVTIDEAGAGCADVIPAELAAGAVCASAEDGATIAATAATSPACSHRARRIIFEKAPRRCGRMQNRPMDCAASEAA